MTRCSDRRYLCRMYGTAAARARTHHAALTHAYAHRTLCTLQLSFGFGLTITAAGKPGDESEELLQQMQVNLGVTKKQRRIIGEHVYTLGDDVTFPSARLPESMRNEPLNSESLHYRIQMLAAHTPEHFDSDAAFEFWQERQIAVFLAGMRAEFAARQAPLPPFVVRFFSVSILALVCLGCSQRSNHGAISLFWGVLKHCVNLAWVRAKCIRRALNTGLLCFHRCSPQASRHVMGDTITGPSSRPQSRPALCSAHS